MVESTPLPSRSSVTTVTGDTQFSLVHIVVQVAGNAGFWCLAEFLSLDVACATFDFGMQAKKDIVGQGMIKRGLVQASDICVSSFVICMTVTAGAPCVQPSMKTGVH